jgi:hypothetical protein
MLRTPDREGAMTRDAVKTRARPTGIRPQLQTSSVIPGDELSLLDRVYAPPLARRNSSILTGASTRPRKMEPHPEETADFSAFSKMRRIQLDRESVIGRELLERFAEFDESFTGHSRIWAVVVKLIGLTAMCSKAVIDLEKQVIELRRELRSRDKA